MIQIAPCNRPFKNVSFVLREKSWQIYFQMVKIDNLKIIWTSFSNKPLKFGQILIKKLLGFIKNETKGKVDVQIRKFTVLRKNSI